jgi:hypothetical protein
MHQACRPRVRRSVALVCALLLIGSLVLSGCIGLGIGRPQPASESAASGEPTPTFPEAGIANINPTQAPTVASPEATENTTPESPTAAAPTSDPAAPTSDPAAPTSDPAAPTSDPAAPTSDPAAPTSDPAAPTSETATNSTTVPADAAITQQITIDSPPPDTVVGSPVTLVGRAARFPNGGVLSYRFLNATLQPIGSGEFTVSGAPGTVAAFTASLNFNPPPQGGPISVEVFERDAAGAEVGGVRWPLYIAAPQAITFTSPPAGTQVGNPVTVVGNVAAIPGNQRLGYRVRFSDGRELGAGTIDVPGLPGRPGVFTASLRFSPPLDGGTISVELFEPGANGTSIAPATLSLFVAPQPQVIAIDTPPGNAFVGTPVTLTGRTARPPFNNVLGYAIYDSGGRQVGGGIFPVTPAGVGSAFTASLSFSYPAQGGPLRIDLYDQDPSTGAFRATASLGLRTVPTQQQLLIDTPAPGTQVGSPVTLTGRTARYPTGGRLRWRIVNSGGTQLGSGDFAVQGPVGEPTRWVVSMPFNAPFAGGDIRAEVFEVDQAGVTVATATLNMRVAATPPQITITSPPDNTSVGVPLTITGRTNFFPFEGTLNYIVRDSFGNELGRGNMTVTRAGEGGTFVQSITYRPISGGGSINVEVLARNAANGAVIASATVQLRQSP